MFVLEFAAYLGKKKIVNQLRNCLEDSEREGRLIFPANPSSTSWLKSEMGFKQMWLWLWTCWNASTHLKGSTLLSCSKSDVFRHRKGWFDFFPQYMKKMCVGEQQRELCFCYFHYDHKNSLEDIALSRHLYSRRKRFIPNGNCCYLTGRMCSLFCSTSSPFSPFCRDLNTLWSCWILQSISLAEAACSQWVWWRDFIMDLALHAK